VKQHIVNCNHIFSAVVINNQSEEVHLLCMQENTLVVRVMKGLHPSQDPTKVRLVVLLPDEDNLPEDVHEGWTIEMLCFYGDHISAIIAGLMSWLQVMYQGKPAFLYGISGFDPQDLF
jgi:hypothetical protein